MTKTRVLFHDSMKEECLYTINPHITSLSNEYRNAITRMDSLLQVYVASIWNIPLSTWTDPKYIVFIALQKTLNSWVSAVSGLCVKYKYASSECYIWIYHHNTHMEHINTLFYPQGTKLSYMMPIYLHIHKEYVCSCTKRCVQFFL
jgi:hypothetical protein